eukprot:CAMPEP_0194076996 /NCGR_PEP_ID=MMETSP0149-20130528/3697_1 /TAXON_ID=122233 /ORGANISM="Chaetoceros debilis, Strain MM31A-1" /LENGTH=1262 /DNA_ID=CAMNT_0038757887 /DNA_START=246 /DNA_END=4034 /DNA_ORIENTATION=-
MVNQTRQILGHKLANVYDGLALSASVSGDSSGKSTFLFKLANPNSSNANDATNAKDGTESKHKNRSMLLIESGVRFHATTFYTTGDNNSSPPSQFAMKLRKHLRNLRLENVTQLGNLDRVVDFRFGSGQNSHHVILELYGLGNLILTDGQYSILALLRVHDYEASAKSGSASDIGDVKVRVGNVYPVTFATTLVSQASASVPAPPASSIARSEEEELAAELEGSESNENKASAIKKYLIDMSAEEAYQWVKQELKFHQEKAEALLLSASTNTNKSQKKKKDGGVNAKMLLLQPNSGVFHYGPSLIEHCLLVSGMNNPNSKFTLDSLETESPPAQWGKLLDALRVEGPKVIGNLNSGNGKGHILYREKANGISSDAEKNKIPHSDKIFDEYQPHLLKQHEGRSTLTYDSFSMAVDEFYSLREGQKRATRAEAAEKSALDRLNKIKRDQSKRMEALEAEMLKVKEHAELVETHADDVDKAIGVINSALAQSLDWDDINELVEVEKANMNPIALLINRLKFESDEIELSLPDTNNWDQTSGVPPKIIAVSVSLKEGAYGNARIMYDKYRSSRNKASKTSEASDKALKAAESNAQRQIEQAQKNKNHNFSVMTQPQRKQHWFEKFIWFITSDNYLCVGGRDAHQNEQLVRKYLRPGDAYLHADVHGAPTIILRAKRRKTAKGATEVLPLSDQALRDAGNFAICRSSAWASRMVTSAWWVEAHQVSKSAPTGEYLTVGSFMIRGKKNFLPPAQLEMGLAVLFRLGDDASVVRHASERKDHMLVALDESAEEFGGKNLQDSGDSGSDSEAQFETKRMHKSSSECDKTGEESSDLHEVANGEANETNHDPETKADMSSPKLEPSLSQEPGENQIGSNEKALKEEPKPRKKGLSTKEKKLIKKYGSLKNAEEALSKIREEEETRRKKKEAMNVGKEQIDQIKSQVSSQRGKRSKMKKKAKKYIEQDEEDEEFAMFALQGSSKVKGKKGSRIVPTASESQVRAAAETTALLIRDSAKIADKLPTEVYNILSKALLTKDGQDQEIIRWDKLDADILEQLMGLDSVEAQKIAAGRMQHLASTTRIDNFSASLAGIIRTINRYGYEGLQDGGNDNVDGKQRKTRAEKEAEKEAWREILAEDGIIEEGGESSGFAVADDTAECNKLTGKPLPEDSILYAIPVCAPYATVAQYKYRVKLTPGSQKRGKASKQCLALFCQPDASKKGVGAKNEHYIAMMKAVNDNEWVQAICGDVKISAAGASKMRKKVSKKGKKKP